MIKRVCHMQSHTGSGFRPARWTLSFGHWCASSWVITQSEKFASCHPVLLGHDVVQNRVDCCTKVKEYKGDEITVVADERHDRRAHLCGFGDQVASNMKGQPAEHEGKHHHSCQREREVIKVNEHWNNSGFLQKANIVKKYHKLEHMC